MHLLPTPQHQKRLRRGLLVLLTIGAVLLSAPSAQADRVSDLATRLEKSRSDKARIAAALSLTRLNDKRALKPLTRALSDKSEVVRALAAQALGKLGDSRALPALSRATRDKDKTVRRRATQAIGLIRQSKNNADNQRYTVKNRTIRPAHYRVGGQESPRMSPTRPELFVSIRSAADESNKKISSRTRKARAADVRSMMMSELATSKRLTTSTTVAEELQLPIYSIDLSITRLQRLSRGPWVELECEIRIAISNGKGRMMSFLTGAAKVQVPKRAFRRRFEAKLRQDAMENAVKSVNQDLVRYLVKTTGA
jgi:hypothetical protein